MLNVGRDIHINMPDVNKDGVSDKNYFKSQWGVDMLGAPLMYNATEFHFRAKSDHTIMGKRYDLEMQVLFKANEGSSRRRLAGIHGEDGHTHAGETPYAAVALLFDTVNYDPNTSADEHEIIDKFFKDLALDADPASAKKDSNDDIILAEEQDLSFGDLMDIVDFSSRWAYNGSFTEPPCKLGV